MKTKIMSILLLTSPAFLLPARSHAQDTFSIVAVDSASGEVGSAGASCVDLFMSAINDPSFLGDLIPGKGAINTQAFYLETNQANARARMLAGDTPQQIITWLGNSESAQLFGSRQYGIAALVDKVPQTAAHTGSGNMSYANHITGKNYSIQGNILLGKKVLDSMEARFNNTPGSLACKLMAAMQGAKMVGADSRCATNNTSSLFAFLKVSKPTDPYNSPYLNISVRTRNNDGIEPIDSLQKIATAKGICTTTGIDEPPGGQNIRIVPNPASHEVTLVNNTGYPVTRVLVWNTLGRVVIRSGKARSIGVQHLPDGLYIAEIYLQGRQKSIRSRFVVKHRQ
ncbi:DUF1028 domain-containing protein [Taibaiella chishuiensis]|nr:DUF1028 domain-containing protein [Taibaiella chishuiensis]